MAGIALLDSVYLKTYKTTSTLYVIYAVYC